MTENEKKIVKRFHELYYNGPDTSGRIYENTYWMGTSCLKCPLDLWIYQEIMYEVRPDLIIETGTHAGGSALYLAHICDLFGAGHVATIDIDKRPRPAHKRISYIHGSSSDPETVAKAFDSVKKKERVLVILDSDHSEEHVSRELKLLASLVTRGSYLIVEDTNINGHPAYPTFGPGPYEAVQKFIEKNKDFEIDPSREKFLMTFNPRGYLKRIS
ncbi:MAG: cephalosporin hydroxylase [Gammaproteobacteria bacterium]|nr:MAG: cephalosporin hydroxylase [Gammaproteobacteria bacterium]